MQLTPFAEIYFKTSHAVLESRVSFFLDLISRIKITLQRPQKQLLGKIPFSAYLFTSQRMETFSNFGEGALSQFPADQIVSDPLSVIKVLEDVGCRAAQRHREGTFVPGAVWGSTLVAAVHHHVAVNNGHHNFLVQRLPL